MKFFKRKPKHKHTWGNWEPHPYYPGSFDIRRCAECGRREERFL